MRARLPVLLLAAVLLVAIALTLRGYGPLAAHDAPKQATRAAATSPAAGARTTPAAPSAPAGDPLQQAVSEPNRPAFERANVALANLDRSAGSLNAMAKHARIACRDLGPTAPLPAALAATCTAHLTVAVLSRSLTTRCARGPTACTRTATRLSDALMALAAARRAYAKTIRVTVPVGACRTTLLPTGDEVGALILAATAARNVAADPATLRAHRDAIAPHGRPAGVDARSAVAVIGTFHAACHLPRYPDPIG